jgi:hypothetical protein
MINLTAQQLRQAANLQEKIAGLEKQLSQLLGGTKAPAPASKSKAGTVAKAKPAKSAHRKMSAAAKARLSQLAKARWAKAKAAGKKGL